MILVLGMVFSSCENENSKQIVEIEDTIDQNKLYGHTVRKTPKISEAVKEHTDRWGGFNDFEDDVTKIHRNTIDGLKIITDRLVVLSDSIVRHIPDTLHTQPIASRLKVVDTRIQLLHQMLDVYRVDSLQLEKNIAALAIANHNFITHMNAKFAKDDIEESQRAQEVAEIEKLKKSQDSIFKAELRDSNKL